MTRPALLVAGVFLVGIAFTWWQGSRPPAPWSPNEIRILGTLQLSSLPPRAPAPGNAVADNLLAAQVGHALFFDTRLSITGEISCATCHQPERRFTDGLPRGQAIGRSGRNTATIVGSAYSPWFYWDGRKDSQWSQALAPLEDPAEHGGNRLSYARLISEDPDYRDAYEALFGPLPPLDDRSRFPDDAAPGNNAKWNQAWQLMAPADQEAINNIFANIGRMLAAYQRKLMPGESRFDRYVAALLEGDMAAAGELLSTDEVRGLRLFIGEARCLECHNGPLFTNNAFHNTGLLPPPGTLPDLGRSRALTVVRADPFNCLGPYSGAAPEDCLELVHIREGEELIGAMRTASLRNLDGTAPYMHLGQMTSIAEVLRHYNAGELAIVGHNEAEPLGLSGRQLKQLERFLESLQAPLATDARWLRPSQRYNETEAYRP